jgi:hypothetical protein
MPLMAEGPYNTTNAASSVLDSSADSSDSYNGDDACRYL